MGWPLAVANGLTARRGAAVFATGAAGRRPPAGDGVVLVPFALLAWVVQWSRAIRIGAGLLVLSFGAYRLVDRRHPRCLARIPPTRLAWWSFLMATAHGAGLMLVPILWGCARRRPRRRRPPALMARASAATARRVSLVHTAVMIGCGVCVAWLVYR